MKIVLDSSVLVAAFYKPIYGPSFSKDVYDYVVEHSKAYVSVNIIKEVHRTLREKLKFSVQDTEYFLSLIQQKTNLSEISTHHPNLLKETGLRDPNDLRVLELAINVDANFILTWDKDLLVLNQVNVTKIMTPRIFWTTLGF